MSLFVDERITNVPTQMGPAAWKVSLAKETNAPVGSDVDELVFTGSMRPGGKLTFRSTSDSVKGVVEFKECSEVHIKPEGGKIELTDIATVTTMLGCRGPNLGFALWPDLDDENSSRVVIRDRGQADEESIRFEERSINVDKSTDAVTMRHYGIHYQQDGLEHRASGVMNLYDALAYVTAGILNDNRDVVAIRSTVYNPSGTLNDSRNCLRLQQRNPNGNGNCIVVEQSGAGDAIKFEGTGTGEGIISRDSGKIELRTTTSGNLLLNPADKIDFNNKPVINDYNTKQGSATILAGSTSVTVSLADANTYNIVAIAADNMNVWITNKTKTGFDINVSAAPATDLIVDWIARR